MVFRILHPILASTLCAANPVVSKNTNDLKTCISRSVSDRRV